MFEHRLAIAVAASSVLLAACSNDGSKATTSSLGVGKDAGSWTRLIEGAWTLQVNEEKTRLCFKKQLTEDVYLRAIRPVHPKGTHHTIVTLGDGTEDCTAAVASGLVYAAGLGSNGVELPDGVAMKLPKGKYLNLGLHLYNTTESVLTGTTAIEAITVPAAEVQQEAETVLAGPIAFSLPPQQQTIVKDDCAITADQSVFALFPHMHQHGTHIKTTVTLSGVEKTLYDADYNFQEQLQLQLDPVVQLHAGDKVTTQCTYWNDTAKSIGVGESSDTEMCFSVLFRYPKQSSNGFCFTGNGSGEDAGSPITPVHLAGPPCAAPGATGNELGVGEECTTGESACTTNPAAKVCLADYTTGEFGNFCTMLCTLDQECGTGAVCHGPAGRAVCMPNACVATDAGTTDAG